MHDGIVLATCRTWPELSPSDRRLGEALERRGFHVESARWNGPFEPFAHAEAVVIRATWDYHQALDDYRAWLDHLDAARTFNAPALVRWNLEKSYLTELAARGAPVPASAIVEADAATVVDALERMALTEAVITRSRAFEPSRARGDCSSRSSFPRSPRVRSPASSSAARSRTAFGAFRPRASFA